MHSDLPRLHLDQMNLANPDYPKIDHAYVLLKEMSIMNS